MRAAIVAALLADATVAALVGERVYVRRGEYGGVSREATAEAFTDDGALLPSLVVWLETRRNTASADRQGRDTLTAAQGIAVGCMADDGYELVDQLVRAVRGVLHHPSPRLLPLEDAIGWADTRWDSDSGDLIDPALQKPIVVSRYVATVTIPAA